MKYSKIHINFSEKLQRLIAIIDESEARILAEDADTFFVSHANFLVKAYLVSLCSYLEAFLKELAKEHVTQVKNRVKSAKIPHNMLQWAMLSDPKDKSLEFKDFTLEISIKNIDDEISGNPFRTAKLFKLMGVDLESSHEFKENKELVNNVVTKRNKVIHYNDEANDLSLGDIKTYATCFLAYGAHIAQAISES